MAPPPTTCVSSPGKVLLAGGYLVLDPAHAGLVVSTSSRFYTVVAPGGPARPAHEICVRSPQFVGAQWRYALAFADEPPVLVEQIVPVDGAAAGKNKFVHLALQRTLSLAVELKGAAAVKAAVAHGLDITIVGDNDFYSQRAQLAQRALKPTIAALAQIPPFVATGGRLADVHKTGLGSSAALITSLVAALLLHLGVIAPDAFAHGGGAGAGADADVAASEGRRLAHNLAQYVHCLAQGKVGSGFDVAAAVFGSQVYTRFDPAVLQPLMQDALPLATPLMPILSPFAQGWNYGVRPFRLPPRTRLVLADVDAGSDTPSLVGKVLKWRQADSTRANALWKDLDASNTQLTNALLRLSELHAQDPEAYDELVKYISSLQTIQWLANPNATPKFVELGQAFHDVHTISETVRTHMREMGTHAGVPIEPPEQTELLNACVAQAGVIAGGVPGAGGYDALWLLVCDPPGCAPEEHPLFRVERVWETWVGLSVSPLAAAESEEVGCRVEDVDKIRGLREALAAA